MNKRQFKKSVGTAIDKMMDPDISTRWKMTRAERRAFRIIYNQVWSSFDSRSEECWGSNERDE